MPLISALLIDNDDDAWSVFAKTGNWEERYAFSD
jgi:hypothetical protein